MIELRTLGGLELYGPQGHDYAAVLAQSKRLALLVHLALAYRDRFARRDTIIGLFWPALDGEHARSALRQSLTFLRRALGDDLFERRGAEDIGVRPEALEIDAGRFERACDAGDLTEALDLYRGDFLQGLFVSDVAPELERWIEDERARLLHRAGHAAWELVARSEAEGNLGLAAEHARRAVALDPHDEQGLRRLMTLLGRTSNPGGAVRAYETFARRLADDLEVAPTAETAALAGRLRSRSASARGAMSSPVAASSPDAVLAPAVDDERSAPSVEPLRASMPRPVPTAGKPARRWAALAAVVGIAVFAGILVRSRNADPARTPQPFPAVIPTTANAAAWDLFVKGRFVLQQETLVGLQTAARYLEEAVRADSGFAQAWATLAMTYAYMSAFGGVAPNEAYPRAQAAAVRALKLDPASAEGTLALAHVSAYFHWDWTEGERLFRRAIDLAPTDATARTAYGDFLSSAGHLPESIPQYEHAKTLDPSSRRARNNLARRLIWNGDLDRAMAELTTALTLEPRFARGHRTLGILYMRRGRYTDAISELSQASDLSGGRPFDLSPLAEAYILDGKPEEALRILAGLERRSRGEYVPPYAIATIHASLGHTDEAFAWLDSALDVHDATLSLTVLYETMLDPIRDDPRFAEVLKRMRLPV